MGTTKLQSRFVTKPAACAAKSAATCVAKGATENAIKSAAMAIALCCLLVLACCLCAPKSALAEEAATQDASPATAPAEEAAAQSASPEDSLATPDPSPASISFQETTAVAHSEGSTTTYYYSVDEAITAAKDGLAIYMDCDWNLTSTLIIPSVSYITINMNGHKITNSGGSEVIYMKAASNLKLISDTSTTFTYKGYTSAEKYTTPTDPDKEDKDIKDITIESGGLITGGKFTSFSFYGHAGGIYMEKACTLDLSNVAVAGNYAYIKEIGSVGGIFANEGCRINLHNGASIEHNKGNVGGIYATEEGIKITLDASTIKQNYAMNKGGGIYSNDYTTHIDLKNNSTIESNVAMQHGGGVYLNYTNFTLESSDSTGVIKDNIAGDPSPDRGWDGGGVYVNSNTLAENEGSITNLTFSGNICGGNGGAIYLDQQYTTISNCTITGNKAGRFGGGISVDNNYCTLKDCTIRNNVCNIADTGDDNCEGGGVYVYSWYDLKLSGVMIVKDNTRGENGSKDDLFLGTPDWQTVLFAYVTGGVSKGSSVGIRTGTTNGDVRIGKNINNETKDSFFIDLPGYYVSYGTDEGGDMWQRYKTLEFGLSINGTEVGRYQYDAAVTASGAPSSTTKHFWYWDAQETTGLYPVSDYITNANKFNESLSFAMPQNNANLVAVYADNITKLGLYVQAPEVGKTLPQTGVLKRTDGGVGGTSDISVSLTWYETNEHGEEVAVEGTAQAGKTYYAKVSAAPSQEAGLFFSQGITEEDVTVYTGEDTENGEEPTYAAVSASTGVLSITTQDFEMPKSDGKTDPDPVVPDDGGSDDGDGGDGGDQGDTDGNQPASSDSGNTQSTQSTALASTGDSRALFGGIAAFAAIASALACAACYLRQRRQH